MLFGIRGRLVGTYLLVITLTVLIVEVLCISAVSFYYKDSVYNYLKVQSEAIGNYYKNYLSNTQLSDNAPKLVNDFYRLPVQIQVFDGEGKVLADSLHRTFGKTPGYPDLETALAGRPGSFAGEDGATGERICSFSIPLENNSGVTGAVRLTSSLETAYSSIYTLAAYLILAGMIIILLVFFISLYLSGTIINPIKKIIAISSKIAKGDLSARAEKVGNDEIGTLAESINHMTGEIQKSDRLKNEFISSISHELRTPLTSIKGWAMTLAHTAPEDRGVIDRGIHIINSETDRLSDMVEELLDFSRLQSGNFSLEIKDADINAVISEVTEQMKPRADRQGVLLEAEIPGQPQIMPMDARRIKQVLINLADNSLKFTPAGGSIVITAGVATSGGNKAYRVTIRDTGCGIDKDELPAIKNRFYRGRNAGNTAGIGLGLSICFELVRSHGGSMEIDSESGAGTTVVISLPLKV